MCLFYEWKEKYGQKDSSISNYSTSIGHNKPDYYKRGNRDCPVKYGQTHIDSFLFKNKKIRSK